MNHMRTMNRRAGPGESLHGGNYPSSPNIDSQFFWQVWPLNGNMVARSVNLTNDLPKLDPKLGKNRTRTLDLESGAKVMVVGGRFGMGRTGVEISIAKDLKPINDQLIKAIFIICGVGLIITVISIGWVYFIVTGGLAPLRNIADQVESINTQTLGSQFDAQKLPKELFSVVSQLNELMERLETGFSRERRFNADLSHELKTPIAELRMIAESAIKWPEEGGQQAWSMALESINRAENVILTMLRLARLEKTQKDLAKETFSLPKAIQQIWTTLETKAKARKVNLSLDQQNEAQLTGDPSLWNNLLGNLLGNSVEYADTGTEIVVTFETVTESENTDRICISNAASLIKAEEIPRLFDRFWRGNNAREESNHCGLGLSLAVACAQAQNYQLRANKRSNDGWLEMWIEKN
jgi:signal transduction histidine kinase